MCQYHDCDFIRTAHVDDSAVCYDIRTAHVDDSAVCYDIRTAHVDDSAVCYDCDLIRTAHVVLWLWLNNKNKYWWPSWVPTTIGIITSTAVKGFLGLLEYLG